jgi:hypothetical protein
MSSSLRNIQRKLDNLPKEAYQEFVKETPIRSGNARRKTKLKGKTIVADYAYAKRLDEGYSKQSPDGMTKPTEDFIQKRATQIMKGKK